MKQFWLFVLLSLIIGPVAGYMIFYDGNTLYSDMVSCSPAGSSLEMNQSNILVSLDCAKATGYIMGAVDTMTATASTSKACLPSNVVSDQLRDVVYKWLQDNPAKRQLEAPLVVQKALLEAWPCPEE